MGFLSGLKKVKRYIKLSDGYKLLSIWTSSQSVEMDDGSTLESNKPNWDDKYTRSEVDNKLSAIETNIDWKESVDTFADITTTYPDPQDGWTVNVRDTDYTYRYSGEEWVVISANAIPKATQSIDGLLTKEDKTSYDSAVEKKHEHDNKSALDMITSEKIAGWDELSQNSVTGVKGNKEETYRTGNVNITKEDIGLGNVDNTSDKDKPVSTAMQEALDTHTNNSTIHLTASDRQQFFRGNADWGWRNPEWTEDVDGWVLPGCYGVSATCTHLPPHINEPWGNLLVFPSMEGRILQIYYDWNDPDKIYHRVINGTTASNWMLFADDMYGVCTTGADESTMEISSDLSYARRHQKMTIYFVNGCNAGTKYLKINGQTAIRMYCQGGDLSHNIPRGSFVEVIFIDGAAYLIDPGSELGGAVSIGISQPLSNTTGINQLFLGAVIKNSNPAVFSTQNYSVKLLKGGTYMISGQVRIETTGNTGNVKRVRIMELSNSAPRYLAETSARGIGSASGVYQTLVISPKVVDLTAGNEVAMYFQDESGSFTIIANAVLTYMTLVKIPR